MPKVIQPLWNNFVKRFGIHQLPVVGIYPPEGQDDKPGERKSKRREHDVRIFHCCSFDPRPWQDVSNELEGEIKQLHPLVDVGQEFEPSSIGRDSSRGVDDLETFVHQSYPVIEEKRVEDNHGQVKYRCKPRDRVHRLVEREAWLNHRLTSFDRAVCRLLFTWWDSLRLLRLLAVPTLLVTVEAPPCEALGSFNHARHLYVQLVRSPLAFSFLAFTSHASSACIKLSMRARTVAKLQRVWLPKR